MGQAPTHGHNAIVLTSLAETPAYPAVADMRACAGYGRGRYDGFPSLWG